MHSRSNSQQNNWRPDIGNDEEDERGKENGKEDADEDPRKTQHNDNNPNRPDRPTIDRQYTA